MFYEIGDGVEIKTLYQHGYNAVKIATAANGLVPAALLAIAPVLGLRHILAPRVRCAKTSGTRKSLDAKP